MTLSTEHEIPGCRAPVPVILLAAYGVIWLVLAVNPVSRQDWFLENLLVFAAVPLLWVTRRRWRFSNLSYLLITVFLTLHALGAHYTYSLTPPGDWLRDGLQLGRNHYDRLVHLAFGSLLTLPVWEMLRGVAGLRSGPASLLSLSVILAGSGLYEILEAVVAMIVDPDLGAAYTGTQGDEWDAQKDMLLALTGALMATAVIIFRTRSRRARTGAWPSPATATPTITESSAFPTSSGLERPGCDD
jgi:putative membrane protein